jgi:hypothetical protein
MTTVLAVAIGLMLMYLILSLIVSAMNEGLASLTDRRANFLVKGVRNLLGPDLTRRFYQHGLISGLTRKRVRFHAKPSYISSSTFGTALLDVVTRSPNLGPDRSSGSSSNPKPAVPDLADVKERAEALEDPEAKDLREAMLAFADESDGWSDFKKRIEAWFDEAMERVSGWYRRRTRIVLWGIALVLVGVLNADTVNVARVLWLDPTVRSAAEAAARQTVQEEGAAPQPGGDDPAEVAREAADAIQQLEQIGLPLRWSDETTPNDLPGWLLKFVGLLITAFALTFGAPFWFDLLKKFVGVRSSGPPPPAPAEPEKKK